MSDRPNPALIDSVTRAVLARDERQGTLDNNDHRALDLARAAQLCPNRPRYSALWRWCRKGIKVRHDVCIQLGHSRVGGRIYTTQADLSRILEAIAEADAAHFSAQGSRS